MSTNNTALFITNTLSHATTPTNIGPARQAQATATAIVTGINSGTTNYNVIMQPITFIANTLVNVMNYIATAALVIAGALFAFEILKMAIEYMINHEASKLTKTFIRKILLFLIISAAATHLQEIMSFIFGSFVSFGQAVGSNMISGGGATSPAMGNPLSAWYWLLTIFQYTMQSESKAIPSGLLASIGATPYLIANAVFMYAILTIIFLLVIYTLIQFFIIQIEILIQISIGAIAIAFSMLSYTDHITKNYFKSLITTGLRLFTIIVIIYFFNYCMIYAGMLMEEIETQIVQNSTQHPFQIIMTALLSILFLAILVAFMVAKGPAVVANAFNGSGEGSGMDAGMVMAGGAALAYGGVSLAGAGLTSTATVASGAINAGTGGVSKIREMIKNEETEHKKHTTINPTDFKQPDNKTL
ncbi:MAG: type IV secretion system protein [bacterium]